MLFVLSIFLLATSALCDNRIVGGENIADRSVAPWQASLQVGGSHFCGGSLISANTVMTACHCKQTIATVVLGTTSLSTQSGTSRTGTFVCHENYRRLTIDYDYAVVTLSSPVAFEAGVIEAITVASEEYSAGTPAEMTGWGKRFGSANSLPDNLQFAVTYLISQADCAAVWGSQVTARMQCANDNTNSACNGDSGGPLVVYDNGTPVLVGNTSWGVNGCDTNYPSAWSKNSEVHSWIQTNGGI